MESLKFSEGVHQTIAEFMSLNAYHENDGYYINRDAIGLGGDFITSPEISQIFGEIIGAYLLHYAEINLKNANHIVLAELGPGRGTLMSDILRIFTLSPKILSRTQIMLLEVNQKLMTQQRKHFGDAASWYSNIDDLLAAAGDAPLLLVANEFFDCLPIHQFINGREVTIERLILEKNTAEIVESSPQSVILMTMIAKYLAKNGGCGLIIDYGYSVPTGKSTLQAVKNHQKCELLTEGADISAEVNFAELINAIKACDLASKFMTQAEFLTQFGIYQRAAALGGCDADVRRLVVDMGEIFKVLVLGEALAEAIQKPQGGTGLPRRLRAKRPRNDDDCW